MTAKAKSTEFCFMVIPTSGRDKIAPAPLLFPKATLMVRKSEVKKYRKAFDNPIHEVPDDLLGTPKLRNYCARTFAKPGRPVCQIDDDVIGCCSLTDRLLRELSPGEMHDVIQSTARAAMEAGAPLFGFSQSLDLVPYKANDFIRLSFWAGSLVGFTGPYALWDERLRLRSDVDASLNAVLKHRFVWIDTRFCFMFDKDNLVGGNCKFRSAKVLSEDFARVAGKWGQYLNIVEMPDYTNMIMRVPRRRSLRKFYKSLDIQSED